MAARTADTDRNEEITSQSAFLQSVQNISLPVEILDVGYC